MLSVSEYSALAEERIRSLKYPAGDLESLYAPVEYAMQSGGKRLRPVIMLMACEAFGGKIEDVLDVAAGIEMFHNFTLLHDDVMDNSDTRRGRASVPARFGVNASILSGDTMLTLATMLIGKAPATCRNEVMDVFNRMAIEVYEGQALDMLFENKEEVSTVDYVRMVELKTGALLGAAARIGAMIAGATEEDAQLIDDFGRRLGIAFQIQDDLLDCFGDASTFGKPIGGDILNGKKTWLYLSALESGRENANVFLSAMKLSDNNSKIKTVTGLYTQFGVEENCRKAVAVYSADAMSALRKTAMNSECRKAFHNLSEKLIGRKK